jgi:hypothetical protein
VAARSGSTPPRALFRCGGTRVCKDKARSANKGSKHALSRAEYDPPVLNSSHPIIAGSKCPDPLDCGVRSRSRSDQRNAFFGHGPSDGLARFVTSGKWAGPLSLPAFEDLQPTFRAPPLATHRTDRPGPLPKKQIYKKRPAATEGLRSPVGRTSRWTFHPPTSAIAVLRDLSSSNSQHLVDSCCKNLLCRNSLFEFQSYTVSYAPA